MPINKMVTIITKPCILCGKGGTVKVPLVEYEIWKNGELIQLALRSVSANEREQLLNGTHPKCWEIMMCTCNTDFPEECEIHDGQ